MACVARLASIALVPPAVFAVHQLRDMLGARRRRFYQREAPFRGARARENGSRSGGVVGGRAEAQRARHHKSPGLVPDPAGQRHRLREMLTRRGGDVHVDLE